MSKRLRFRTLRWVGNGHGRRERYGHRHRKKRQSAIFDRFTPVVNDRLNRSGGTGLGLNIAQKFVDLMGGSIVVESRPRVGTTFTVQLSLALVPAPPAAKGIRSSGIRSPGIGFSPLSYFGGGRQPPETVDV